MGFHRHRFEQRKREEAERVAGEGPPRDERSERSGRLRNDIARGRVSHGEIELVRELKRAASANASAADTYYDLVEERLPLFKPAHVNVVLSELARLGRVPEAGSRASMVLERVLNKFVMLDEKPKHWENSSICQALGALDVRDVRSIQKVTSQALREYQHFGPAEILQVVKGLSHIGLRDRDCDRLIDGLCRRALELMPAFEPTEFIDLTQRLGLSLTVYKPLFHATCSRIVEGVWKPELQQLGVLAAGLSEANFLRDDFNAFVKRSAELGVLGLHGSRMGPGEIVGLCRCLRSLEIADVGVPEDQVIALRAFVEQALPRLGPDYGPRVLRQLAPVLINRGIDLPEHFTRCLSAADWDGISDRPMRASKTELKVSGILDGMGINHQHGGSILTYSTDFVLTSASGARLNLEVDGDAFHRVRVVGESAKTAERTLRDVFRDRVLNKAGIETVRFFISEFDHLTHRDKEKFLWGLLKDFLRQDRVHGI